MIETQDEPDKPKRISVEYNYFGDGEFRFDEDIVRRIRFDADPKFVPMFKREVYRYSTGGTKIFKHFGFGIEHTPGFPVLDQRVYGALKPHFGFLAQLGRCLGVSIWAQGKPFASEDTQDGTPGETVPFDERAYSYALACNTEMRRLAAEAPVGEINDLAGVPDELRQLATRAVRQQHKEVEAEHKRTIDAEEAEFASFLRDNGRRLRDYFQLSDYDRAGIASVMMDPNVNKAVHFGPPARPARPGSPILAPL